MSHRKPLLFALVLVGAWLVALFPAAEPAAFAQGTVTIIPTSGPPGTLVTVFVTDAVTSTYCEANGVNVGTVGQDLTLVFAITQQSGTVEIRCMYDSGQEFPRQPVGNLQYFTVTAPAPDPSPEASPEVSPDPPPPPPGNPDADRDGVPDANDACPYVSGQGDQFGGVTGADGCPVDSDGDGINDGLDHCPFAGGPEWNNGCPVEGQPAQPAAQPVGLPTLPQDGVCNIATATAQAVNLRGGPSTGDEVVAQMTYDMIMVGVALSEDGQWFQLADGSWVAAWVVRTDAECAGLGRGAASAPAEAMTSGLPAGWEANFAACPSLVDSLLQLPPYVVLDLMTRDDPCGDAEALLGELVFASPFVALSGEQFDGMLAECPMQAAALAAFFDNLAAVDRPLTEQLQTSVPAADRCAWGQAVLDKRMLPVDENMSFRFEPRAGALLSPSPVTPPGWAVVAAVECFGQQAQDYAMGIAGTLVTLGFSESKLASYDTHMCSAIEMVSWLSDLSTHQLPPTDQALFERLVGECGLNEYNPPTVDTYSALHILSEARQMMADVEAMLNDPALCENGLDGIYAYAPLLHVAGLDPTIPEALRDCPQLANQLRLSQPHFFTLYTILAGPKPTGSRCSALATHLEPGVSLWPPVAPECAVYEGREIVGIELPDGTLIDINTPWHQLIAVLDRADPCAPLELPVHALTASLPDVACYSFSAEIENTVFDQDAVRAQLVMRYTDGRDPTLETSVFSQPLPTQATHAMSFTALVHDPEQSPLTTLDYEIAVPAGAHLTGSPWLYEVPIEMCRGVPYSALCDVGTPQVLYPPDNAVVTGDVPLLVETELCTDSTAVFVTDEADQPSGRIWYGYHYPPFTSEIQEYIVSQDELENCTMYYWTAKHINRGPEGRVGASDDFVMSETRSFFTNFNGECDNVPTCGPAAPVPVSPPDGEVVIPMPELRWSDESGCAATSYLLEIAHDPDFADTIVSMETTWVTHVPWLTPDEASETCATHYWRVRGIRSEQLGPWSPTQTYLLNPTQDCLPVPSTDDLVAPVLEAPTDEQLVYSTIPAFQWAYEGGAQPDSFSVTIYSGPGLASVVRSGMVSGDVHWWMPTTPLEACEVYYWTVTPVEGMAYNAVGGPVSETGSFTIECSAGAVPSVPDVPVIKSYWPVAVPAPESSGPEPSGAEPSGAEPSQAGASRYGRSRPTSAATIRPATPQEVFSPGAERSATLVTPQVTQPASTIREAILVSPPVSRERTGTLVITPGLEVYLMGSGSPADIYLLADGTLTSLTDSPAIDDRYPVLSPGGDLLAYLSIGEDGQTQVMALSLARRIAAPIWGHSETLTVVPAAPAWSPNGAALLLTLQDAEGTSSIYALDMRAAPAIGEPELLIADAAAPVFAPNGRYLAFEREVNGRPSIVVALVEGGQETFIETGLACQSPTFGENSIDLYFTCLENGQSKLYHYGLDGLVTVPVPLANVYNPSAGPGAGFLVVDDGTIAYFVASDGSEIGELVQLPGLNMTHVRWASAGAQ